MARIDLANEHLSDYERAICYYSLPRMTRPVTVGLLVLYSTFLIEASAVLAWGIADHNDGIKRIGAAALATVIVIGIVAFILRAFLNEVRLRRAIAGARGVPDTMTDIEDIPDPFKEHILLRHPLHRRGDLFPCTDRNGKLMYFVESAPLSSWWKVKDPHDNEVLRVRVQSGSGNFSLSGALPSLLTVYTGAEEIAKIHRPFAFNKPVVHVDCRFPEPRRYTLLEGGIYRDKHLVGRVYYLHHSLYLDIQEGEFHDAILALFIAMG